MPRAPARTETHFETAILDCSSQYNFGTDWRGDDAPAPLIEGLSAELTCAVLSPVQYATRTLEVHMMTAPDTADSLRPGGPPLDVIGHLTWSKDHQVTLWLPSDDAWWFITNAIRSGQFAKLSFTAEGALRGRVKISHLYFSGDDESSEGARLGRLIEGRGSDGSFDMLGRLERLDMDKRSRKKPPE